MLPSPTRTRVPWPMVLTVALVPTLEALWRLGRLHPDEVFQAYEPALQGAFGYGQLSWEWAVGLRNWFVPGVFSVLLEAAHGCGVDDAWARRAVLAVPQFGLTVAMVVAVFRIAERRVGARSAKWALPLLFSWAPWVWFAARPMGESLSAALLVLALEVLDRRSTASEDAAASSAGDGVTAGVLFGLAEVTRYGSAAFIVPVLGVLAAQRRWPLLRAVCVGGAVVALGLGLLDRLTWGRVLEHPHLGGWWHSLFEYLRFNVFTGGSSKFGRAPLYWYVTQLWCAPVLGVVGLARSWARRALFVVPALVYFVAISITEHKEARFVYPALLVVLVAAIPPFIEWWKGAPRATKVAMTLVTTAASLATYVVPTPFDVEQRDVIWAQVQTGRDPGVSGVAVVNDGPWGTGGSFFFGRDLPWCAAATLKGCALDPLPSALLVIGGFDAETQAGLLRLGYRKCDQIGRVERWYFRGCPGAIRNSERG